MKKLLLIVFTFSLFNLSAQQASSDYFEGVLYFKINPSSGVEIPVFSQDISSTKLYSTFPEIKKMLSRYKVVEIKKPFKTKALSTIYKVYFTEKSSVDLFLNELASLEYVQYASKAQIYRQFYVPNDVDSNQWYMGLINAYAAWDITTGKSNIKVAIVDDACKISHPDLAPIIYNNTAEILDSIDNDGNGYIDDIHGYDVADNDYDPEPPASHWMYAFSDMIFTHGTHCAGIAGAATDNGMGIASIGNGISIIPVKCTSDNSILPLAIDEGAAGIDYAIAAGADVISLSWGGGAEDPVVTDAINAAYDAGIVVVAAAGNNGDTTYNYPACNEHVISVGAITKDDIIASFSERNTLVDVMAPGDSIWSTIRKDDGYMYLEGTSMACPMVAGLCGLMLSLDSSYTPDMIESCLKASCDNIDSLNPSAAGLMGAGRINAYEALNCMMSSGLPKDENIIRDIIIFPNPSSDHFTVNFNGNNIDKVEIYDLLGKRIYEQYTWDSNLKEMHISTQMFENGIYLLKAIGKEKFFAKKIKISR